jgi:hypothetical protein
MKNEYVVTKKWGSHKVGDKLPESREVRRKIQEGGCVEKMAPESSKNKMQKDTAKNKGAE